MRNEALAVPESTRYLRAASALSGRRNPMSTST